MLAAEEGLDIALGIGGLPKGRVVEIYGPESSGKTTLAIHAIANVQKSGGIAAIIDAEHAFDRFYAEELGNETYEIGAEATIADLLDTLMFVDDPGFRLDEEELRGLVAQLGKL